MSRWLRHTRCAHVLPVTSVMLESNVLASITRPLSFISLNENLYYTSRHSYSYVDKIPFTCNNGVSRIFRTTAVKSRRATRLMSFIRVYKNIFNTSRVNFGNYAVDDLRIICKSRLYNNTLRPIFVHYRTIELKVRTASRYGISSVCFFFEQTQKTQ